MRAVCSVRGGEQSRPEPSTPERTASDSSLLRSADPEPATGSARGRLALTAVAAGLAGACLAAFCVRAIGFQGVFVGDDVILAIGDGQYHARLALYSLVNFPALLTWDPYINFPDGSSLPSLPVLGFLAAALTRLAGGDAASLERVLAWWSPVTGALTPLVVYPAARVVARRGVALGAAWLAGLFPVLATASHVGNADHNSLQALLGAALLGLVLAAVAPGTRGPRRVAVFAGLALARLAILTVWSGSLLYVILADGLLLVAAALGGRRSLLVGEFASLLATAALLVPAVLALGTPPGGPWSAIALSRLHVAVLAVAAAAAGGTWLAERWRPRRTAVARLGLLLAVGAVAAASVVALPGPRAGLALAFGFLAGVEAPRATVFELMPLLPVFGRAPGQAPELYLGTFAWLVPLAPLGPLLAARRPEQRAPALVLAGWTAVLAPLAVWQVRFGTDFAAAGAIAFALLLDHATRPLARGPRGLRPAVAVAVGLALLWVPLRRIYAPGLAASAQALAGESLPPERLWSGPTGSLVRFMREVRRVTPDTSGYLGPGRPEYGILCRPRLGHTLHYEARRASTVDGLLYTLDPRNYALVERFFAARSESQALAIATRLRSRYVLTMHFPGIVPGSLEDRLQRRAGLGDGDGSGPLRHFRLVTEGPADGAPLGDLFGYPRREHVVPYRLFEIVRGAVLEVRAEPDALVSARLRVATPLHRPFAYEVQARTDADGVARLRVAYPTDRSAPTRAAGPYVVRVGERSAPVAVSTGSVQGGETVVVSDFEPSSTRSTYSE